MANTKNINSDMVSGYVKPGFEPVYDKFLRNFESGKETGASLSLYHKGEKVIDIWPGYAHKKEKQQREEHTLVLFFSATKGLAVICFATTVSCQEKKHAIGVRDNILSPSDFELTYQYSLNEISRFKFGLGTAEYLIQTSFAYQLVGNLSSIMPGLKVYGGGGLIAGFHSSKTGVGVLTQGGLEYNFRIPLQVSLDYRPKVFWPGDHYYYDDLSISLRYKF